METKVTIVGFGTMGKAIALALFKNDPPIKIYSIDKDTKKIKSENIKESHFVILAVKPQDAKEAIEKIKIFLNSKTIIISIMAGVSIDELTSISSHKKIIRMMPNLGLSVGAGIAAWKAEGLSSLEVKISKNFINKITDNFEVKDENMINKVTAISGSGPAYFFFLADALVKACLSLGFSKKETSMLVEKTLSASALLGKENKNDYSALITKIASKKGTTESALEVFKKENLNGIIFKAVKSAYGRAEEIGGNKK